MIAKICSNMKTRGEESLLQLLLLYGVWIQLSYTPMAQPDCFPAIFNFGDSTSDTGGIHASFPTFTPAEFSPYGDTYFGQPAWRYSDGRLLIDFIAEALGLPFLDPYLQSVTSDFTHGANFATAGATVLPVTYLSPFHLSIQVKQYLEFKRSVYNVVTGQTHDRPRPSGALRMKNSDLIRRLPLMEYFTQGLYTIAIGGNDFSYGYTRGQSIAEVEAYLPNVANGIIDAIKILYNNGARYFLVWDIEPQGCLPYMLTLIRHTDADLDEFGCLTAYNDVSEYFNTILKSSLDRLRPSLTYARVIYLSTYDIKTNLLNNLTDNGFFYTDKSCCGVPNEHNFDLRLNCGLTNTIDNVTLSALPCADPSQYTVWDGIHNTEAANRYIANQIFTGNYFDPPFFDLMENCNFNVLT